MAKMHYVENVKTSRVSLCGKSVFSNNFATTSNPERVSCQRCIESMKKQNII